MTLAVDTSNPYELLAYGLLGAIIVVGFLAVVVLVPMAASAAERRRVREDERTVERFVRRATDDYIDWSSVDWQAWRDECRRVERRAA